MTDLPIPGEWILQGGAGALLAFGIWMILTGRLVPRAVLEDVKLEREYWREIAMTAVGHTDKLLPAAHIATQVSRTLADQFGDALHDVLGKTPSVGEPPEARS